MQDAFNMYMSSDKTISGIKYYLLSIYLFMVYLVTLSETGIYNVK